MTTDRLIELHPSEDPVSMYQGYFSKASTLNKSGLEAKVWALLQTFYHLYCITWRSGADDRREIESMNLRITALEKNKHDTETKGDAE